MNIIATDEDIKFVKEAERLHDWHVLTTWKQRFIYQRYVALPRNDIFTVKEIAKFANETLYGKTTTKIKSSEELARGVGLI